LQTALEFPFDQSRIVLGRAAAADVRIPNPTVSEAHASVQLQGNDWLLSDLGSRNGTKHNGQRLVQGRGRKLSDGDLVEIGTYVLSFHSTSVVMTEPMSAERTAELARRLWREAQSARGVELPPARLRVVNGPRAGEKLEIPPAPSRMHIGTHDKCQLVLPEPALARDTLELVHDLEGVLIRSLLGEASLRVGGHQFQFRRLRDGDEVQVGSTRMLFEEPAQSAIDALRSGPDVPLSVPPPAPAPAPERTHSAPSLMAAESVEEFRTQQKPKDSGRSVAELAIYALAIAVLVASALALAVLLGVR
jgi:hypothetical protein